MIKALVSCLLAVAALVAGANTSEAAGFQFVEQHFVDGRPLFGVQYRVFSGDPVTFQSVCFTAVGGGTSIRFHSLGGPDRPLGAACNSVDLSGLFVVLVADIPVGPYSITLIASVNGTGEETARFTFGGVVNPPPPPPLPRSLRVRAALWTGEGNGPFEPAAGAALPANAVVPLGALLTVQAIDQDGSPLISTFTLAEQSPDPSVDSNALFPGLTLHQYVSAQPDQAILQAVHKGSVKIVVTPSDSSIPGERLTVIVGSPQSLGTSGASVDDDVVETAHRTGVPPHFIKAHVWKESFPKWNRSTYRYEPIGPAGDLQAVSRAQNLRTRVPYTQYRLATVADSLNNPGLAQGPLVTNLDRDARQALHVGCNSSGINGTPIGAVALAVNPTAWEIFRCNDTTGGKMNWTTNAGGVQRAQARVT